MTAEQRRQQAQDAFDANPLNDIRPVELRRMEAEIERLTKPQPAAVTDDGMRKAAEFLRIERDELKRQRDIAVAALEKFADDRGTRSIAREALKEIGESK